ncbi:acyl-CoA N-acyltransferase [Apiospora saccharicola]|uniref:Acyl-CoA N-acyltransferase n=1 Tax=Apiospora saccharicola TaxID=335842 RepID=A0ABR1TN14_9PEZI
MAALKFRAGTCSGCRRLFPATSAVAQASIKNWLGGGLKDPHSRYVLAVDDTQSGDAAVVALAKWVTPGAGPKSAEAEEWAAQMDWPEDVDGALGAEFFTMLEKKHKEHMGTRPHWYLELLAVRKSHHGKGLGKHLLSWGLERADQDGVEAYLQASPAGVPLYRKYGFEDIETVTMSRADNYAEVFMKRQPRQSQGVSAS